MKQVSADDQVPLIGRYKRAHFVFLFLNALFTWLFVFGCAVWINYRAIFQSGIVGFFHVCTGVLIGAYVVSDVLELERPEVATTTSPLPLTTDRQPPTEFETRVNQEVMRELRVRRQRHEFRVFRRCSATIITISTLAIIISIIYMYNLFYILINICPQYHAHAQAENVVEVRLSYEHRPPGEYYAKRNFLIFRYNLTAREVIQKTRHTNPNVEAYHSWFTQNEIHAYDSVRTHATAINQTMAAEEPLFCMKRGASIFSFMENEINHVLFQNLRDRRDRTSFRILDLNYNSVLRTTNEEEEDMDLHLLTNKICRNEQALAIAILCFLMLWALLNITNVSYNIWLLQQDDAEYAHDTQATAVDEQKRAQLLQQQQQQQQQRTMPSPNTVVHIDARQPRSFIPINKHNGR
jgi:hypothetical protein